MNPLLRGLAVTLTVTLASARVCADEPAAAQLPQPIDVCLEGVGPTPVLRRAIPMPAGVRDPRVAPRPQDLNWIVSGAGCVAPPALARASATCGGDGRSHPLVRRVLCQQ